ncbi:hypothetical protein ACLOJK_008277 [Asimina triloba]
MTERGLPVTTAARERSTNKAIPHVSPVTVSDCLIIVRSVRLFPYKARPPIFPSRFSVSSAPIGDCERGKKGKEGMGRRNEGDERKKERGILALTGAAALAAISISLLFTALTAIKSKNNRKKTKDIPGLSVRVNPTAAEILKLADSIIAKSKEVHDSVASVPLDKVTYANAVLPLAELEAQQFPLVQSCVFQKMIATSDDVQKASAEAERRIDSHLLMCSKRDDVYRVLKAFAAKGEWISLENKYFVQRLVKDFERNGMNLTLSKREEVERLNAQINELSMTYVQNLDEDDTTIAFRESELAGLPQEFIKKCKTLDEIEEEQASVVVKVCELAESLMLSLEEAENGKLKISLRSHHVTPILEHCKLLFFVMHNIEYTMKVFQALESNTPITAVLQCRDRCKFKKVVRKVQGVISSSADDKSSARPKKFYREKWLNRESSLTMRLKGPYPYVHLRHKLARLLGYSNYADYVVELRMARTSTKVFEFLEEVSICFTDVANRELNILKDLKKKEEGDFVFGTEDLLYYVKRAEEQAFNQDSKVVFSAWCYSNTMSLILYGKLMETETWTNIKAGARPSGFWRARGSQAKVSSSHCNLRFLHYFEKKKQIPAQGYP